MAKKLPGTKNKNYWPIKNRKRVKYHTSGKPRDMVGVHDKRYDPFATRDKRKYGTGKHDEPEPCNTLPPKPKRWPKNQGRKWFTEHAVESARIEEYGDAYWYNERAVSLTKTAKRLWELQRRSEYYLRQWRNKEGL